MRTLRQEAGMTPLTAIVVVILVLFMVFLGLKLAPVYLEYFNVVSSVNSLRDDPDLGRKNTATVLGLLKRRFEINDVKRVKSNNVKITRSRNKTIVEVKYEARVSIVGNIDLIASFEKRGEFQ